MPGEGLNAPRAEGAGACDLSISNQPWLETQWLWATCGIKIDLLWIHAQIFTNLNELILIADNEYTVYMHPKLRSLYKCYTYVIWSKIVWMQRIRLSNVNVTITTRTTWVQSTFPSLYSWRMSNKFQCRANFTEVSLHHAPPSKYYSNHTIILTVFHSGFLWRRILGTHMQIPVVKVIQYKGSHYYYSSI